VKVFDPASTRAFDLESESKSELFYDWRFTARQFIVAPSHLRLTARFFILRLAVYRQAVHPGAEPFETHGQIFFSIERLQS
jgi:hypothetical protein